MNGIFISQCCGCAGKQCTRRYNFDDSLSSMDVAQFRAYDDPGGSTPVTVYWDYGAEELDIEGEGCYAVEIIPASVTLNTIHVAAMVAALTTGSVGVTIRRPESAESISLWWLGGTSYELRHGTTVLESITHTAATDELKLELTTPKDPTTDVLVYIGGALVHTESAVAFVMPDVLNLGVAIDGEATVDWVEVSPCPPVCGTSSDCDAIAGVPIPKIWTVEVPATTDSGSGCTGYCESFAGTFRLLARKEVSFIGPAFDLSGDWVWQTAGVSFLDNDVLADLTCAFVQIRDTKDGGEAYWIANNPGSYSQPINAMDPATWPIESRMFCVDPAHPTMPYLTDLDWQVLAWVFGFELDPLNPTTNYRLSMVTYYRVPVGGGGAPAQYGVKYSSAYYLTSDPTPLQGGPITLNLDGTLDGSPGTTGCTFPATVTVTPGTDAEFMGRLCETGCDPPVTPQPGQNLCMQVTLADADATPINYSVTMVVSFNEATGSWEWAGSLIDPWEHPTCGTIPASDYKIHCVEPEEGAAKQWVLDITTSNGTSRIVLSDDPTFGLVFDGTSNVFCSGETWDVFVFFPAIYPPTTDIFGCEDTTCRLEGWCISADPACGMGTCTSNPYGNHLSATSSNPPGVASKIGTAFTGPYPLTVPSGHRVWLWEDGGGVHLGVWNGSMMIDAVPVDIDCDQEDKVFSVGDGSLACCSFFGGVDLILTPCGGPIVHA